VEGRGGKKEEKGDQFILAVTNRNESWLVATASSASHHLDSILSQSI